MLDRIHECDDLLRPLFIQDRKCNAEDEGKEDDLQHVAAGERGHRVVGDDVEDVLDNRWRLHRFVHFATRGRFKARDQRRLIFLRYEISRLDNMCSEQANRYSRSRRHHIEQ